MGLLVKTLAIILVLSLPLSTPMVASASDILSRSQVYNLVVQNGGNPNEAGLLTAIAFGAPGAIPESSGNSTIINNNSSTGDYSVGLWQINFRSGVGGAINPTRTLGGVTYTISQIQNDVDNQAKAALAILRGTGLNWNALSTQWGGFRSNPAATIAYGQQLTNEFGGGTTNIGVTTPTTTDTTTGTEATTPATTTAGVEPSAPAGPATGLNLGFTGSIQHIGFQFLLVIIAIALMLGGIYLLGSKR